MNDAIDKTTSAAADAVIASELIFSEMLDRVKEVAHDIDERVHHVLDLGTAADA